MEDNEQACPGPAAENWPRWLICVQCHRKKKKRREASSQNRSDIEESTTVALISTLFSISFCMDCRNVPVHIHTDDNHDRVLNKCLWRMLCPKYTHPLTAGGDQLILGPSVISSGGELLPSHVCAGGFIPDEDPNMDASHPCYVRASSFSEPACTRVIHGFTQSSALLRLVEE